MTTSEFVEPGQAAGDPGRDRTLVKKNRATGGTSDTLGASQSPVKSRADAAGRGTGNSDEVPVMPSKTSKSSKSTTTRKKAAAKASKTSDTNAQSASGNDAAASVAGAAADAPVSEAAPGGKRTISSVLGEITWLMSQSPLHKTFFIGDLEWMVMTPIVLEQFRIFYSGDRPVGVALWARVSEEVETRLEAGGARMAPNDWRSGDRLWVVELIAPFGGQEEMLKDLQANVFGEEKPKMRVAKD